VICRDSWFPRRIVTRSRYRTLSATRYGNANVWKYFTDLFDYLPLTALIDDQVRFLASRPDLSRFVVPAEDRDPVAVPHLERDEERDGLDRVVHHPGVRLLRRVPAQVRQRQRLEVLYRPLRLPALGSSEVPGGGTSADLKSVAEKGAGSKKTDLVVDEGGQGQVVDPPPAPR
jgi:diadenosine tetraphosphatase ApaH/serine/threonine PP2A family protein phosphatase